MERQIPRVLLTAAASGGGKTTITCGILQALLDRGNDARAFKCGPDYIDPMFHKYVLGVSGGNLDTWFLDESKIQSMLTDQVPNTDGCCTVIEGVMGFYDGVAGISTQASAYDVARVTDTPVILILDGRGASLSLCAVMKGFLEYRTDHHIRGVILNRTSKALAERLHPLIEEMGVGFLGYVPECTEARLESRHLGLIMPEELDSLRENIKKLGKKIEETVDLDLLLTIAGEASPLEAEPYLSRKEDRKEAVVRIGVASDQAFCFYYQENLSLLERMGAVLVPFSPLKDSALPGDIDGLLLGGGYPENYAAGLEANKVMRNQIRTRISEGLPVLAECGGFLYLHEQLEGSDGLLYQMAGVISGRAFKTEKLGRFGYIELEASESSCCLTEGEHIRGHEFHYWDSTSSGSAWLAKKPRSSQSWSCMHERGGMVAGFPHLYYPSNPDMIERWLAVCRRHEGGRRAGYGDKTDG